MNECQSCGDPAAWIVEQCSEPHVTPPLHACVEHLGETCELVVQQCGEDVLLVSGLA